MTPSKHCWWLRGLHLLLALSLPFLIVVIAGCKRASAKHADLGPEVDPDVIQNKLWAVRDQLSIDGIHVGRYVNTIILRRVENSDEVSVLGGVTASVMDAQDTSDQTATKYTVQINKAYLNDKGGFDTISSEDNLTVTKPSAASAVPAALALETHPQMKSLAQLSREALEKYSSRVHANDSSDGQPTKITYHHFQEGDENFEVPDKVKMKADCGGLSPCQIPMHYIRFDMVAWYGDDDYQTITFDFGFSISPPWLPFGAGFDLLNGAMIADCRATFIEFQDQNVYVRDCQQLDDFEK